MPKSSVGEHVRGKLPDIPLEDCLFGPQVEDSLVKLDDEGGKKAKDDYLNQKQNKVQVKEIPSHSWHVVAKKFVYFS